VVIFTTRPLYLQKKSPSYPLDRTFGGHQSWFGRGGEEKNSQTLPGLERRIIWSVAQRYTTDAFIKSATAENDVLSQNMPSVIKFVGNKLVVKIREVD
jgi:hypothetical protein